MTEILTEQDIAEIIVNRLLLDLNPDVYSIERQDLSGGFEALTVRKGNELFVRATIGPKRRARGGPKDAFGFEVNNSMLAEWEPIYKELMADIENGIVERQHTAMIAAQSRDATPTKPSARRGMNDDTRAKLERLCVIRRESIKQGKVSITWTTACRTVGIDPDTARKHAQELRAQWDNPDYHADSSEIAE